MSDRERGSGDRRRLGHDAATGEMGGGDAGEERRRHGAVRLQRRPWGSSMATTIASSGSSAGTTPMNHAM